jgi:hypothetical protein
MDESDSEKMRPHVERWGDLYYSGKASPGLLDKLAFEMAVLWKNLTKRKNDA